MPFGLVEKTTRTHENILFFTESIRYRMFVPLGGGLGPELLVPPHGPAPPLPPSLTGSATGPPTGNVNKLPKLEQIVKNRTGSSDSGSTSGSGNESVARKSGETTPLDLSKSPDSLNCGNNNRCESVGAVSDTESETIVPDQRQLPPPLRYLKQA